MITFHKSIQTTQLKKVQLTSSEQTLWRTCFFNLHQTSVCSDPYTVLSNAVTKKQGTRCASKQYNSGKDFPGACFCQGGSEVPERTQHPTQRLWNCLALSSALSFINQLKQLSFQRHPTGCMLDQTFLMSPQKIGLIPPAFAHIQKIWTTIISFTIPENIACFLYVLKAFSILAPEHF